MLEIKNVKKSFGKQEVLKDVSLRVENGQQLRKDDASPFPCLP